MESKKKLLIFHPALAPYRVDFFNELGKLYNLTVVFLTHNNKNQAFDQEALMADATYEITYLDKHYTFCGRNINFGYWDMIKYYNPDIIISSEFGVSTIAVNAYKILHKANFSHYTTCDDSEQMVYNCNRIRKAARRFYSKRLDGIICVNPVVAELLVRNGAKRTTTFPIIYNDSKYRTKIESSYNITSRYIDTFNLCDQINILYIGRLTEVKNISALLSSFAKIKSMEPISANLILVGDGDMKSELINQTHQYGLTDSVKFVGRYEGTELLAWYGTASFFILPSKYEPFGAVTSEALQAGCPVMISSIAGSKCLVNSSNGVIFSPHDQSDFIGKLKSMIAISEKTPKIGFRRKSILPQNFMENMNNLYSFLK